MRLLVHWIIFIALLLPFLWLGYTRVHHLNFLTYVAALGAIVIAILCAVRLVERLSPTPSDNEKEK